jgi:hypothetical protein
MPAVGAFAVEHPGRRSSNPLRLERNTELRVFAFQDCRLRSRVYPNQDVNPMKAFITASIAAAIMVLNMPANAHMRCGWQWPNDDVYLNTKRPTFTSTDCMASQLNQQELMNNGQMIEPMRR